MSLKNTIRLYERIDKLFLAGIFLIIVAVILVFVKKKYNFFLFAFGALTLLLKYFRKHILYSTLQKTKYKGAFISLVDKIGIDNVNETFHSDFTFYRNLPIDYSTETFIKDNNLKTVIGKRYDKSPYIIYLDNFLKIGDKSLKWTDIINWSYYHGNSYTVPVPSRIEIEYKTNYPKKTLKEDIELNKINSSHIDILMLLYHFKKVYG